MELFVIVRADLRNKRAVDSAVNLLLLFEAVSDLLRESKAKIEDRLTLQHFLGLVEFCSHELLKVIIENEVFKLGELLRHDLLLDLVHDVVGLVVLKVALHVHFLSELRAGNEDVFVVVESIGQEFLMSESHQISLLVENVILVLVFEQDDLVVFFQDELRAFDVSRLIEEWND